MEINRFQDVVGVVTTQDIVEGRFVVLCPHSETHDFGSREDLAGVRLPLNAEDAKRAKFCITWPVNNSPTPIYQPTPSYPWSMRAGGFDQAGNIPFDAKVRLTYPGYQESETIPSGNLALAFTEGTFTIPSGQYIYSADIILPGAAIIVENVGDHGADAGKPVYAASMAAGVIGFTERYDSATGALTIRVE